MLLRRTSSTGLSGMPTIIDGIARIGVVHGDVADRHAAQLADRRAGGTAHAAGEAQEDRRVGDLAHRDVRDRHVLEQPAVHRLEREAARAVEHDVRDRDVPEPAVRLGAELDASRRAVAVGRRGRRAPVRAVEHRAHVEAAHDAVRDRDVLRGARLAEREGALEHDRVVVRRVHVHVRDAHVAAGVDVDAVAVRVDGEVVDREVVDAGGRIAMWPPRKIVKSRSSTLRERLSAIALFAWPGRVSSPRRGRRARGSTPCRRCGRGP